ncbi:MAG TPA: YXWGXW repeat-containing protein [Burkholderiaceae bacterium]
MKTTRFTRAWLLVLGLLAAPAVCFADISVGVSIGIAPPPMPVYVQPPVPAVGYIWTPGYWSYDPYSGYYWVPGTWVLAPAPGLLWTPGYWGFGAGYYSWHPGYWGERVGFYGGINYGYGYFGAGFSGGYWNHGAYYYNRSVSNVTQVSVTNVYNQTVVNARVETSHASFNGGTGGIQARATAEEEATARAPHHAATNEQMRHDSAARAMPALRASANHGQPPVAATAKPGVFSGRGISVAQGRQPNVARESAVRESGARAPAPREAAPRAAAPARAAPGYPTAQRGPSGPMAAGPAAAPYREAGRAPAQAPQHPAMSAAPARPAPPAREGGQGQRHEGKHEGNRD